MATARELDQHLADVDAADSTQRPARLFPSGVASARLTSSLTADDLLLVAELEAGENYWGAARQFAC